MSLKHDGFPADLIHFPHAAQLGADFLQLLDLNRLRLGKVLELTEPLVALSQHQFQFTDPLL